MKLTLQFKEPFQTTEADLYNLRATANAFFPRDQRGNLDFFSQDNFLTETRICGECSTEAQTIIDTITAQKVGEAPIRLKKMDKKPETDETTIEFIVG